MKTILVIGMSRFGYFLCENAAAHGNQVMAVDIREETLEPVLPFVTSAKIGDCTNPEVLKSLGVANFDVCFVCIGTNFQSSLEITSLLKEMGAKRVVSKAKRDIHAKFLLRNGADDIIYPDKDAAERTAVQFSYDKLYNYIALSKDYSIYEISPMKSWVGKSIRDVNVRGNYNINILVVKGENNRNYMPGADYIFNEAEHLVVICKNNDVQRVLKEL